MLVGLAVLKALPIEDRWSLLDSSPGPGRLGSFKLRFMATAERRRSEARPAWGEPRLLLVEERREMSAALIVAAAAKDTEEDRGDGEGVWRRRASGVDGRTRDCIGEDDVEREGGRELRSGDIMSSSCWHW